MNAEQIARALGGKRAGRQWKCKCVAHDDHDPSMIIFDGRESVQVRCLSGCDPRDIIAELRRRGLWEGNGAVAERSPAVEQNNYSALALRIWEEATDPRGTPVEAYLKARGLMLTASPALRFHQQCPFDGSYVPAVVVLMCDIFTGRPCAIQRLRLDVETGRKVDAKMLGPTGHAAMMLTSWHDTFSECMSFCPRLFVCEGCETGIALANYGYGPIWAMGSAGSLERLPALYGVGELIICADHDREKRLSDGRLVRPGIEAAVACRERWLDATRPAHIWLPKKEGNDFADWAREKNGNGHAA